MRFTKHHVILYHADQLNGVQRSELERAAEDNETLRRWLRELRPTEQVENGSTWESLNNSADLSPRELFEDADEEDMGYLLGENEIEAACEWFDAELDGSQERARKVLEDARKALTRIHELRSGTREENCVGWSEQVAKQPQSVLTAASSGAFAASAAGYSFSSESCEWYERVDNGPEWDHGDFVHRLCRLRTPAEDRSSRFLGPSRHLERIERADLDEYDANENFRQAVDLIKWMLQNEVSYIEYLGIEGLAEIASKSSGKGRMLWSVDSGCDESHPALQQSLREHVLYDSFGHHKESMHAIDRGCHGSKVTGATIARPVSLSLLGIDLDGEVGLGIAPGADVSALNALDGGPFCEGGSLIQIASALEDIVRRRRTRLKPDHNSPGYEACNIGLATQNVLDKQCEDSIDLMIEKLQFDGIAVILPCGNSSKHASRLGTKGIYVGACDVNGKEWGANLPGADVLVPGVNLLLPQPSIPQLGHHLIGLDSGTAFAAGVFSGIVLLLAEHTGRPTLDVANTLVDTAHDRRLQIPNAVSRLCRSERSKLSQ